ncbi:hypothetical protein U9M48_030306 [Paspalum notatum var. saurae]|uniref:peroxidase n=1 Tax=Paspalum notatum var. saurae TaxID=547442 RepID=A0AAQ3U032_PASNO
MGCGIQYECGECKSRGDMGSGEWLASPLSGDHREPRSIVGGTLYCILLVGFAAVAISSPWIFVFAPDMITPLLCSSNVILLVLTGIFQQYWVHQVRKVRLQGYYDFSQKLKRIARLPFATIAFGTALMPLIMCDALDEGYYAATCPDAASIVRATMERLHYNDPTLAPALIRLLFHDCFVRGCDASVLISPSPGHTSSERAAVPNHTLRGFNAVDAVKRDLESACPDAVSCADALALMARDAVALLGGDDYPVALGRRDGTESNAWEVDLPAPFSKLDDALAYFAARGFGAEETVVLFGAHTVGGAHCGSFRYRLTGGAGGGGPAMDDALRCELLQTCGGAAEQGMDTDPAVFFDPDTPFAVDNNYYKQIVANRTLLQVDQEAAAHPATAAHVAYYAAVNEAFVSRFSQVMAKLSNVGVIEGDAGEVRKVCSRYN